MSEGEDFWSTVADFLGAPVGGCVLAIAAWFGLSEPCPIGTTSFAVDCLRVGGAQLSMGEVSTYGGVVGFLLGAAIHLARS